MQGPSVHRSFRRAHEYAESALQIVNNPSGIGLSDDDFAIFIGFGSEDFWNKARNPTKHTILHDMIENYHIFCLDYALRKAGPKEWIVDFSPILLDCEIELPPWFCVEQIGEHVSELRCILISCIKKLADDAFYLLFNNRTFLAQFNKLVASKVIEDGLTLDRADIPPWLKNAVENRDRGICQLCHLPINSPMMPEPVHYDHMVPLKMGGTNDPTNLQLSHRQCNLVKGANLIIQPHYINRHW